MSTDLHTLSGAYALNALSPEEAEQFRRHLDDCAVCRQEVAELQDAASQMGQIEAMTPPPHLKARVLAAADQTPQLPPKVAMPTPLRRRPRWGAGFLVAAAAALILAVGGVGIFLAQSGPESQLADGVVRVFEADDANTATVETTNGGVVAVATSPSRNEMAVDTDELPPLDDEHVYQLWSIVEGQPVPVTVLQPEKGAFMPMPAPGSDVAITIEPLGGSERPTTDPVIQVTPSEV